ncbi:MAG: radical SAM protein [Verrucomicrobiota bacterium]
MRGDQFFAKLAGRPPFVKLHPRMAEFFQRYLAQEKVVKFGEQQVVNSHLPPYPSGAFSAFASQFQAMGESGAGRRLFSVTWAVTNRCGFNCWHCYNAGRSQQDISWPDTQKVAAQLQSLGVVMVTLTGGEPLLRSDLEQVASLFGEQTCVILGTTGEGLTLERARRLKASGVFACGISLDSSVEAEHDRMRGRPGAFQTALQALRTAGEAGLYPYVVTVATHEFIQKDIVAFLKFIQAAGAQEVHLLEPCPTGALTGQGQVLLTEAERTCLLGWQKMVAERDDLPILSSLTYLESAEVFGCGAGLTHLYIDGSGEVCPCNLVPMSFGNLCNTPLNEILDRMGRHFQKPRTRCAGRTLTPQVHRRAHRIPATPEEADDLCTRFLSQEHPVPEFFQIREAARDKAGQAELETAYNQIHGDYDNFWVTEAAGPVDALLARLPLASGWDIFEAGCGTGYATQKLAALVGPSGRVTAADISQGMLTEARRRLGTVGNVTFLHGDALEALSNRHSLDLIFTSWVLGYIPLEAFFANAVRALRTGGLLVLVVHQQNTPRRPLEIFAELVAENPAVLQKQVFFDFPWSKEDLSQRLRAQGLEPEYVVEGEITFQYPTANQVLEHLLKSGAGTAYYDALDPIARPGLEARFLEQLTLENGGQPVYKVSHKYVSCMAKAKAISGLSK